MVLRGLKWCERLRVCDLRVRGSLLFRCMVAWLCWHFCNFPWLHKVLSQTSPISQVNFAAWRPFRSPFRSCEIVVWGCEMALMCQRGVSQLRNGFIGGEAWATKWFRSGGPFSQQNLDFAKGGLRLRNNFIGEAYFRMRGSFGCWLLPKKCYFTPLIHYVLSTFV